QRGAPAPRFQRFLGSSTFPRPEPIREHSWHFRRFRTRRWPNRPPPRVQCRTKRGDTRIETELLDPKEGPVEDEEPDEETAEDEEFPEDLADGDDEEEPAAPAAATEPPEEGEASLDELLTSRAEE